MKCSIKSKIFLNQIMSLTIHLRHFKDRRKQTARVHVPIFPAYYSHYTMKQVREITSTFSKKINKFQ